MVENWNSGQKSKFWTKIEILGKNWNFRKQEKIEILILGEIKHRATRSNFFDQPITVLTPGLLHFATTKIAGNIPGLLHFFCNTPGVGTVIGPRCYQRE